MAVCKPRMYHWAPGLMACVCAPHGHSGSGSAFVGRPVRSEEMSQFYFQPLLFLPRLKCPGFNTLVFEASYSTRVSKLSQHSILLCSILQNQTPLLGCPDIAGCALASPTAPDGLQTVAYRPGTQQGRSTPQSPCWWVHQREPPLSMPRNRLSV